MYICMYNLDLLVGKPPGACYSELATFRASNLRTTPSPRASKDQHTKKRDNQQKPPNLPLGGRLGDQNRPLRTQMLKMEPSGS